MFGFLLFSGKNLHQVAAALRMRMVTLLCKRLSMRYLAVYLLATSCRNNTKYHIFGKNG